MNSLYDDRCPTCGSTDDLSVDRPESDTNVLWCQARCSNCGTEWRWFYRIEGVEILDAKPWNPASAQK